MKDLEEKGLSKKDSLCLKGLAIFMLLLYHLFRQRKLFEDFAVSFFPLTEGVALRIAVLCKICVSIFAFITGYGLLKSIQKTDINRKKVVKWNISRLLKTMSGFYFIYILTYIITMIVDRYPIQVYFKDSITEGIVYSVFDFMGLSKLFATPTMLETWWYMSAAIIFILMVPVVYLFSKKVGYLPIMMIVVMVPRILNMEYPGGQSPYTFLLPLILGMMFSDYNLFDRISGFLQKKKTVYVASFFVMVLMLVFYYYIYCSIEYWFMWELEQGILPVFVIIFFRYFIIRIPILSQLLEFIGKHSMNIFLTHNIIRQIYFNKFIYSFKNFMVIFIVLLLISLAISIVLEFLKKLCRYDVLVNKITSVAVKGISSF